MVCAIFANENDDDDDVDDVRLPVGSATFTEF